MIEFIIRNSVLLLLLFVLRKIFNKKMNIKQTICLWVMIPLQMIIMFFGGFSFVITTRYKISERIFTYSDKAVQKITGGYGGYVQNLSDAMPSTLYLIIKIMWITGMIICFSVLLLRFLKEYMYLKINRQLYCTDKKFTIYTVKDENIACIIHKSIYVSESITTDAGSYERIIGHEKNHYYNRHGMLNILICLYITVFWFNPLVWIAAKMILQDCEIMCDADATAGLSEAEKKRYCELLLDMAIVKSKKIIPQFGGKTKIIKNRINGVLSEKKPGILLPFIAFCSGISIIVICCAFCRVKIPSSDEIETSMVLEAAGYYMGNDKIQVLINNYGSEKYDIYAKEIQGCINGEWKKIVTIKAPYYDSERNVSRTYTLMPDEYWGSNGRGTYRILFRSIDDISRDDYNSLVHCMTEKYSEWPLECGTISDYDTVRITYIVSDEHRNQPFTKVICNIDIN